MPETAEYHLQHKKENDEPYNQKNYFSIGRLSVFVLKRRVNIIMKQRGDDVELKNKRESESQHQTYYIESSFRHDGTNQFLGRYFFITGQYGAFHNFSQTGRTEIYKITDHHSKKSIEAGRKISHGFHELSPAKGTKPVRH